MQKITHRTHRRVGAGRARPALRRPERPSALSGASVGAILDAIGATTRRLNDYLVLLHVAAGLALLAFSVNDILQGGPARPMIVPILGAYMSASVVFYVVLKYKRPILLLWINGLSDVVFIVAAHRLAYLGAGGLGTDLTGALIVIALTLAYGIAGQPRLSFTIACMATAFCGMSMVGASTGYPAVDLQGFVALLIVAGSSAAGYRLARLTRRRELSRSIGRLERLEAAIMIHRLQTARRPA